MVLIPFLVLKFLIVIFTQVLAHVKFVKTITLWDQIIQLVNNVVKIVKIVLIKTLVIYVNLIITLT